MTTGNLILACTMALASAACLSAQSKSAFKIPRSADGHPDLQGIWTNSTRTPFERTPEFAGKATLTNAEAKAWETKEQQGWKELDGTSDGPLHVGKGSAGTGAYNVLFYDMGSELIRVDGVKRTSMVSVPPDGRMPAQTEEARLRNRAFGERGASVDNVKERGLAERCIGVTHAGPPMLPTLYNNHYQIVQTADTVMILTEEVHDVRYIHLNTKQHLPANVRQWVGDSIGHWEGDALVVETTNFTNMTRFRGSSENLKVTERFTRASDNSILYQATMEDPGTWARPWTIEIPFISAPGPIYEYACHEGNYAIEDILGGARNMEAAEKK